MGRGGNLHGIKHSLDFRLKLYSFEKYLFNLDPRGGWGGGYM